MPKQEIQPQPSQNLLEPIEPPKISENLLPALSDILQPPLQDENGDECHS